MIELTDKTIWEQQRPATTQAQTWSNVPEGSVQPSYPTAVVPNAITKAVTSQVPQQTKQHAYTFLDEAVKAMKDRALQRDAGGERSMASTVAAFNALTGHNLTEGEGWEFMILLKMVRGRQGGFRGDDYTDGAAYFGLLGECESTKR